MVRFSNRVYLQQMAAGLQPKLAFPLDHPEQWPRWRAALRVRVNDLLGGIPPARHDQTAEVLERREETGYIQERIVIRGRADVEIPAYFLIPVAANGAGAGRAVLCLHGHGRGKIDVVGDPGDGTEDERAANRAWIDLLNYDFACRFAQMGYVVLAPDARGFGERADGSDPDCYVPGVVSLLLGLPITGQRLIDDLSALDYLSAHPIVNPVRIGCVGLSEGGKRTLYLAALDDRIRAAVISGYFTTLKGEIRHWRNFANWDICNYVPGLLRYADYTDLAALIAPRPLLIESGTDDDLYDQGAVSEALQQIAAVYNAHGVPDRLSSDVFAGGHRWSGQQSYSWLDRWL